MDVDDDTVLIRLSAARKRRQLRTAGSDLDFAYQLQMQEAMNISSSSKPPSSSYSSNQPFFLINETRESPSGTTSNLLKRRREHRYRNLTDTEFSNMKEIRNLLKQNQAAAHQIVDVPVIDLTKTEDWYEKPYTFLPANSDDIFRVYFRGLVSDETVMNVKMTFAGIGVAICDESDCCIYESSNSFLLGCTEGEEDIVELKALIEALNSAVTHGLSRVLIFCNRNSVYQYLTGKGKPADKKTATLIDQLHQIQSKFAYCSGCFVKHTDVKFAYQLAKDAILSQATKLAENPSTKTLLEQCTICCESTYITQMFTINKCQHRYCFSCMRKHVEAQLHQGKLPECPHEGCKSDLEIDTCKSFLDSKLYEIMSSRVKEASIPPSEKVYCPISSCSALMSKSELQNFPSSSFYISSSNSSKRSGKTQCVKCHRHFCVNCNVPWHNNMTCGEYIESFEYKSANEAKLKSLASSKKWRQCIKCKNLVELAAGCFHICCRCGYEFCYTCGAEYIKKSPTCKCPLWDERNILYGQ